MPVSNTSAGPYPEAPSTMSEEVEVPAFELSVVLPCLDEVGTVGVCIDKVQRALRMHNIHGEIVVADNGSTDGSVAVAESTGVHVVHAEPKGYGSALRAGIAAASGKYILIGDCDDTYDFSHIPRFLEKLRDGYELVMGNRFQGGVAVGAMPALHRHVGNPVLSFLGRTFFHVNCGDFQCGLRGLSRLAYDKLGMRTTGMEFASEMVVKASLLGLRVSEVPTTLSPARRGRVSHLRTWRDGWRHLRFMLLYSPRWLFLYPGLLLMLTGFSVGVWLLPHPRTVHGVTFDVHTLLYAMVAIFVGFQAAAFAVFSKTYATIGGMLPPDPRTQQLSQIISLELGLAVGGVLILGGVSTSIYAVYVWGMHRFGPLNSSVMLRTVVPSVTALTLGCQIVLVSFFLSFLGLARK